MSGLSLLVSRRAALSTATHSETPKVAATTSQAGAGYLSVARVHQVLHLGSATSSEARRRVEDAYPADLLVEADDLAKPGVAEALRVLDVRPWARYKYRHVAGAVWVDLSDWVFRADRTQSTWERKIGTLGIDLETPVVIYDDGAGKDAAYLWWILRHWGVKNVRVLNGGWRAWLFAGAFQDTDEPQVTPRPVKLTPGSARLVPMNQVRGLIETRTGQLIDVSRNGDFPFAKRLEWLDVIDQRESRFKAVKHLTDLFRSAGLELARPIVICCNSADEAASLAFVLELMGANHVRLSGL